MTRRKRKELNQYTKHLLHEARHARRMREDITSEEDLERLKKAEDRLRAVWDAKGEQADIETAIGELHDMVSKIYPPTFHPRVRENIEILVVALAIAMAFRTFFIQPFKIPTGSMQPTLYGIQAFEQEEPRLVDRMPIKPLWFLLTGEWYKEIRAKSSGTVDLVAVDQNMKTVIYSINGAKHKIHQDFKRYFLNSQDVTKGDLLAKGRLVIGDHIFVNKIRYNFSKPERGDVIVFSTDKIDHPQIRKNAFYIKRLVGLPGETISLDPPYLIVDGKPITSPEPFRRLIEDERYNGYVLAKREAEPVLGSLSDSLKLRKGEYLPFGDNTDHSLDGRYFGSFPEESLVGPAVAIYWPLSKRWGFID